MQSEPGQGSVFRVELPFAICSQDCAQEQAEESSGEEAASLQGLRVLLAEDGDINREIMEVLLEDMGITCISAVNGQEAVEIWNQRSAEIDIVLMDVQMPVMDGFRPRAPSGPAACRGPKPCPLSP